MDSMTQIFLAYLSANSLMAYPAAFAAGVLISFTPCVYPVIPIQLAFVGGQAGGNRRAGFTLSTTYVFGMAAVYSALGAFAALSGNLFGQAASSPWSYLLVGNILLLLALGMFDAISLPTLALASDGKAAGRGRGHVKALLVGMSSALVVGPCTAPALGGLLALVAGRAQVLFGVTVLFAFAFGMGALMIALGTFSGLVLPKAGVWMVRVKQAFAVVLLVASQYLFVEAGKLFV